MLDKKRTVSKGISPKFDGGSGSTSAWKSKPIQLFPNKLGFCDIVKQEPTRNIAPTLVESRHPSCRAGMKESYTDRLGIILWITAHSMFQCGIAQLD
jgi:hypothetical protein